MKNKKIIIVILILSFFALISVKVFQKQKPVSPPFSSPYVGGDRVGVKTNEVSFKDNITGEITVYDFMSKLRSERKIDFTEKNYIGMGKFIETINGIRGNGEKNWIYYVNGEKAKIGVSNYKINMGDIVSWKYEKSNF
ncbi:hypothetical protein A3A07_00810 [Candidatus Nomurabacteria bacterium RIFCSPLOWO2_01_FULL_41_52]|nr:MAG: hypothetical protein A3A07_00810 [Candidatus Nomurabacteria bacterium RIFCSPLOWO2_01_FULL_41_52]